MGNNMGAIGSLAVIKSPAANGSEVYELLSPLRWVDQGGVQRADGSGHRSDLWQAS